MTTTVAEERPARPNCSGADLGPLPAFPLGVGLEAPKTWLGLWDGHQGKIDTDLLQPQKFEAALLDVFDKIATATANDPQAEPAHATLHVVTEAMAQCRDKIASLNQV